MTSTGSCAMCPVCPLLAGLLWMRPGSSGMPHWSAFIRCRCRGGPWAQSARHAGGPANSITRYWPATLFPALGTVKQSRPAPAHIDPLRSISLQSSHYVKLHLFKGRVPSVGFANRGVTQILRRAQNCTYTIWLPGAFDNMAMCLSQAPPSPILPPLVRGGGSVPWEGIMKRRNERRLIQGTNFQSN